MRREGRLRLTNRDTMAPLLPLAGFQPVLDVGRIARIGMTQPTHIPKNSAKLAYIAVDRPIGKAQRTATLEDARSTKVTARKRMDLSATAQTSQTSPAETSQSRPADAVSAWHISSHGRACRVATAASQTTPAEKKSKSPLSFASLSFTTICKQT